jgi:hypothetical protein
VAQQSPSNVAIFELIDRDLASEGAVGLVEDILGCNLQARLEVLASKEKVKSRWSNDNFCYQIFLLADIQSLSIALDGRALRGDVMFSSARRQRSKEI